MSSVNYDVSFFFFQFLYYYIFKNKKRVYRKPAATGPSAMKLGGKARDVDSFVDQLKEEGENVVSTPLAALGTKPVPISPQIINTEPYVSTSFLHRYAKSIINECRWIFTFNIDELCKNTAFICDKRRDLMYVWAVMEVFSTSSYTVW